MIGKLLILLVGLLCCDALLDETNCPTTFKKKCHCGMAYSIYDGLREKKFTVNCTNSGFTDTGMLLDLPEETEVLIFTGNSVPILPVNVLDNLKDYGSLETIDMSNNHIRFIQGKSFHKVYNVKTLILDHNDLYITSEKARPRVFSNFENLERLHMTNAFTENVNSSDYLLSLEDIFYESELIYLKVLHLEQNEIWSIGQKNVFCQLPAIEQILLGDNRLNDFDFNIDCLPSLRYIDLERNMISRLSQDAMNRLDQFVQKNEKTNLQVKLDENPFNCDCRATNFLQWLKTTKLEITSWKEYDCIDGYPQFNVGKTFGQVDDLSCPGGVSKSAAPSSSASSNAVREHVGGITSYHYSNDNSSHGAGYSSATIGVLSFLLVFTSSLLIAIAFFHRQKMKNLIVPYWDYLTRKIGYTGIANEETPKEVSV